jgi:hypothetical protein
MLEGKNNMMYRFLVEISCLGKAAMPINNVVEYKYSQLIAALVCAIEYISNIVYGWLSVQ